MKLHISKYLALIACAAFALTAAYADNVTIIGNLDSWSASSGSASTITNVGSKAAGFTMGSAAYAITGIQLRLTVDSAPGAISVELWSVNTNGKLLSSIATFTTSDPITAGTTSTFTFTVQNSVLLDASTTYYIMPRVDAGSLKWTVGNPSVLPTGVAATAIPKTLWGSLSGTNPSSWTNTSDNQSWYKITGTLNAVPEPATTAILAGACVFLLVAIFRCKRN